jgi:hypothetical protein
MKSSLVSTLLFILTASFAGLSGCADDSSPATDDGSEKAVDASENDLTGATSNFGYFVVTHPDTRKCAAPLCGGFFVKRVNQATTACADGTQQAECHVSSIQLTGIGLSAQEEASFRSLVEGGQAIVKGATYKKQVTGGVLGTLKANEGWVGATGSKADGTFYRAAANGIQCITAPCPTTTAYQLNGKDDHNVIDVHLDATTKPASQASLDLAAQALGTKEGILVAGGVAIPKCVPGSNCGPLLNATEFFLRLKPTEGKSCGARTQVSCNDGQYCNWKPADICGAADAAGVCAYKPDVCYQIVKPVCGCDGQNYGNDCHAAQAGTSVASQGKCP